jgi:hypothetical protein
MTALLARRSDPVATSREPITLIKLMTWAYRTNMVQYETDRAYDWDTRSVVRLSSTYESRDIWARGSINAAGTSAHADAHAVHSYVRQLRWLQSKLIVDGAVKGAPPNWNPDIAPFRVVPMWKGEPGRIERVGGILQVYGTVRRIWRRGNAVGHLIAYEGMPPEVAERKRLLARDEYAAWWNGLRAVYEALHDVPLELWQVTEIGAPREPWAERVLTRYDFSKIIPDDCVMA